MKNILERIVLKRKDTISTHGHTQGENIPNKRTVPRVPFRFSPFLICEIKRRSPSRGDIAGGLDAVTQAQRYEESGVTAVSVLTEQHYFGGALQDLIAVKRAFPHLTVLRKDFLLEPGDIEVSYRAGADAVLLIASILEQEQLIRMHAIARSLGLEVLFEVHTEEDVRKAAYIEPQLTGINSRDLTTFQIDLLTPIRVKQNIRWETRVVFESGIGSREDAALAASSGFDGALVGEAVLKTPSLITEISEGLEYGRANRTRGMFWETISRTLQDCLTSTGRPTERKTPSKGRPDGEDFAQVGKQGEGATPSAAMDEKPPPRYGAEEGAASATTCQDMRAY
jgi:indole-3-glycerol phosphate synthase/phosphoribosylanthranilate isomerase